MFFLFATQKGIIHFMQLVNSSFPYQMHLKIPCLDDISVKYFQSTVKYLLGTPDVVLIGFGKFSSQNHRMYFKSFC